ncbi:glycosyltransferase family A protein [Flavobacterium aquidurense]|uniref:glycosyltransferase family 2 protein n=1 Tax=Flavobacterium aquidurense TaxID=362413 RepID=UPI002858DA3D|nr:glycosyltransferase family A protein [Flavobacterium aquidurense]MDR7372312.1 GT2 family glycosyltransferase [Flavobacterium aquidurense]
MIFVFHNSKKIIRIEGGNNQYLINDKTIGEVLFDLAEEFPNKVIVWCLIEWESFLNRDSISEIIHHNKMMISFHPYFSNYINDGIGYIDNGSILIINKEVSFFTWQMSSVVGAVSAAVLNSIAEKIDSKKEQLDYLLNSIAKIGMPIGLVCCSEPSLLNTKIHIQKGTSSNNYNLFKFVRQHYSIKWVFVLFLSFLFYEKKIQLLPLFRSFYFKKIKWNRNIFDTIVIKSNKKVSATNEIDVIIPTIGRASYLKDVLFDLRDQTHLPKKVIIVEQNTLPNSTSELDFLNKEKWPFSIEHIFTHQAGACNARNIALSKVSSEWVFLNDDDNRISNDVIERTLMQCNQYGAEVVMNNYPMQFEQNDFDKVHQTTIFGSGCSFVKSSYLNKVCFDSKYEFSYGEDFDYGMQLRNNGADVIYLPQPSILHLKAPIGGFRIKPVFPWDSDAIRPIPSPTIMLNYLKYKTKQQILGYKFIFFYNLFIKKVNQNPIVFFRKTNLHWKASLNWATKLMRND